MRRLSLIGLLAAAIAAQAAFAQGSGGSGIQVLRVPDLVDYISADGGTLAFDQYIALNCDAITLWSPLAATRVRIGKTGFCDDEGQSDSITLAGRRLLWEDGFAANTYSDYSVFTLDTRKSLDAQRSAHDLFDYEFTHDDYAHQDYGAEAGPFAGHGSLLVFETNVLKVSGALTNVELWRVDGRRKTLIRRGLDFVWLSVDRDRIAGAEPGGEVVLMGARGQTIRTFRPELRRVRVVVLQGNDLAAAGGGKVVVLDGRSGQVKASRSLPGESRFQDYANGLATLVHGNSIHVLRVSDGKDVVVARPQARGIEGNSVAAEIEPEGLFYTYTTQKAGYVVFVPWKTLQQDLH